MAESTHLETKKHKKTFFEFTKVSLIILCTWYTASVIISYINVQLYMSLFGGIAFWVMIAAVYGINAWALVEDYSKSLGDTVKMVATLGAIAGVMSATVSFIMIQTNPRILDLSMQKVSEMGVSLSREQIQAQMNIGAYIGFVTAPIFNALLAAGFGALGGLVAKKKWVNL